MAVHDSWGYELEIVSNHGPIPHKGPVGTYNLTLVGIKYLEKPSGKRTYAFAEALHADGGFHEVNTIINALPVTVLTGAALEAAIKEAT